MYSWRQRTVIVLSVLTYMSGIYADDMIDCLKGLNEVGAIVSINEPKYVSTANLENLVRGNIKTSKMVLVDKPSLDPKNTPYVNAIVKITPARTLAGDIVPDVFVVRVELKVRQYVQLQNTNKVWVDTWWRVSSVFKTSAEIEPAVIILIESLMKELFADRNAAG